MKKPREISIPMISTPHNYCLRIMYAAAEVDPMAFGFERTQDLENLGQAFCPAKNRADDLARLAARAGVNRPVAFGCPSLWQVRHLDPAVVSADPQAFAYRAVGGYGFNLNPEGHFACVHVLLLWHVSLTSKGPNSKANPSGMCMFPRLQA